MAVKSDLATLLREAQQNGKYEEIEIYKAIFSAVSRELNSIQNLVPIYLPSCSFAKAQEVANSLGFKIVAGVTGRNYLGWAKALTPENIYNDAR